MVEVLIPAIILTLGAGGAIVAFIVHERHAHSPAFARVPNAPILNQFSSAPQAIPRVPNANRVDIPSSAPLDFQPNLPTLDSVPTNLPQDVTTNLNAVHEFLAQLMVPVSAANMAAFQQVLASHQPIARYRDALVHITNYFWKLAQDAGEPKRSQARVFILRDSTTSNVSTLANGFSMFSASLQQLEAFPKNLANLINCFNQFAAICERVCVMLNTPQEIRAEQTFQKVEVTKKNVRDSLPKLALVYADHLPAEVAASLVAVHEFLDQIKTAAEDRKIGEVNELLKSAKIMHGVDLMMKIHSIFARFIRSLPSAVQAAFVARLGESPHAETLAYLLVGFETCAKKVKVAKDTQDMVVAVGVLISVYNKVVPFCELLWADMELQGAKDAPQVIQTELPKVEPTRAAKDVSVSAPVVLRDVSEIPNFPPLIKKQLLDVQLFLRNLRGNALVGTTDVETFLRGTSFTQCVNELMIVRYRWIDQVKAGAKGNLRQELLAKAGYALEEGTLGYSIDFFKRQGQELAKTHNAKAADGMIAAFNMFVALSAQIWQGLAQDKVAVRERAEKTLSSVADIRGIEPQGARFYFEGLRPLFVELREAVVEGDEQRLRARVDAKEYELVYSRGLSKFYRDEISRVFDLSSQEILRNRFDVRVDNDIMISAGKNIAEYIALLCEALNKGDELVAPAQAAINYFNWTVDFCKKAGVTLVTSLAANPKPAPHPIQVMANSSVNAGPLSFVEADELVKNATQIVKQMIESAVQVQMKYSVFMSSASTGKISVSAQDELGAARRAFDIAVRRKGELQELFEKVCKKLEVMFRAIPDAASKQRMIGMLLWRFAERAGKDNALDFLAEQVINTLKKVFKKIEPQKVGDYPKAALDVSGVKGPGGAIVPESVNAQMTTFLSRYNKLKHDVNVKPAVIPTPNQPKQVKLADQNSFILDVETLNNLLYVLKDCAGRAGISEEIKNVLDFTVRVARQVVGSLDTNPELGVAVIAKYPDFTGFVQQVATAGSGLRNVLHQIEVAVVNLEASPSAEPRIAAVKVALYALLEVSSVLIYNEEVAKLRGQIERGNVDAIREVRVR